jgi:glucose dehydrogenase
VIGRSPAFVGPCACERAFIPRRAAELMWRRTYNAWGHSPLAQITVTNLSRLRLAWAWTQEPGNQEAAPLVHNGVMYLAQSNNVVHALDARTGDLLWEYRHPLPKRQGTYVKRQLVRARNSIASLPG